MPKPFFPYYGGKWRIATKHYPKPKYDKVIEPFAGAAGYATHYHDLNVVLYDVDPYIVGVWNYLIRASRSEILSLPNLDVGQSTDDLPIPEEARWLIGFWINTGSSSPKKKRSKWACGALTDKRREASFWSPKVRERLAAQVELIRHWKCLQKSYHEIPIETATWFVDPPYQVKGRSYRFGSKTIDYAHLGNWCQSLPGQAIVCENYGATWLPFKYIADSRTARKGCTSKEAVWLNEVAP